MKDVTPKPSQPKRSIIKCGKKIKKFIDKTNKTTKIENRVRLGSSSI